MSGVRRGGFRDGVMPRVFSNILCFLNSDIKSVQKLFVGFASHFRISRILEKLAVAHGLSFCHWQSGGIFIPQHENLHSPGLLG